MKMKILKIINRLYYQDNPKLSNFINITKHKNFDQGILLEEI